MLWLIGGFKLIFSSGISTRLNNTLKFELYKSTGVKRAAISFAVAGASVWELQLIQLIMSEMK